MKRKTGRISYGMRPVDCLQETFMRACERKRTLIAFAALFVVCAIVGMTLGGSASAYHLRLCTHYLRDVCYTDRNIFVVFLERAAGCCLLAAFLLFSGVHPACLVLPPLLIAYRAYTFGGCIVVFFSVYRFAGALIVFTVYLPIHLLVDAVLLWATALSCGRAPCFCFCRSDFFALLRDLAVLAAVMLVICLTEMILLLVIVHPVGNLM